MIKFDWLLNIISLRVSLAILWRFCSARCSASSLDPTGGAWKELWVSVTTTTSIEAINKKRKVPITIMVILRCLLACSSSIGLFTTIFPVDSRISTLIVGRTESFRRAPLETVLTAVLARLDCPFLQMLCLLLSPR